ncbi:protein-L-isoaspartate(D-aspartate) O-methyltransferase [Roseibium polysiphoniae]|uniref:Protein-L-isoaspartate O-methyltransferase n=1 Tax=Roseibium polysiphoniae TaxID=2571221 RepID=A0A927Q7P2_9HYPH|nr:protein-L-isoaspartate(D-aspartate) O-methyltransferase [Roseibium polysiphoniae]MBD8878765.1 protein-L-isoaspartate(D-aspartate) O-methyltransferase [Roseibium polysiphoniae]MBS8259280.1 protein-L-isoaspartate(D-aspartate) O-methyltransferase [Roseibium polysiphoniae]
MTDLSPMQLPSDPLSVETDEVQARAQLVLALRGHGVGDRAVLSAIERVPRRLFLAAVHHSLAYEDSSLPIECGQVVLAPSFVARMAQALKLESGHRVLEVGTGSGYQAAVLAHLAGQVDSIDRYATLASLAGQRTAALKLSNVRIHVGDGMEGLKQKAPFDRIVLTGAVEEIPEALLSQLAPGGILMAPVGLSGKPQIMTRVTRGEDGDQSEDLEIVRMVSLIKGAAERL